MPYIIYSETQGWDPNYLNKYAQHFRQKLDNLTLTYQGKLKSFQEGKKIAGTINGVDFNLDEDFLASKAMSKIKTPEVNANISQLYSAVVNSCNDLGKTVNQYNDAAAELLAIRNGLIPNGTTFSVDSGVAADLAQKATSVEQLKKGGISNALGRVGEGTSSLAGAAITATIIEELEKQLKQSLPNCKVTGDASYKNMGDVYYENNYRSQTDNNLSIVLKVSPNGNGGEIATLKLSFNISDKANKKLANLTDRKKTTGRLKIRNSTVAAQSAGLDKYALYNTISYHRDENGKMYSGMHRSAGGELRNYIGYKMLLDTLIKSEMYNDKIDFTVYGNRIIPEHNVVEKLLEKKKKNYRYQAEIRYWMLAKDGKSRVKNENEAEALIDKMPTGIGESFSIE